MATVVLLAIVPSAAPIVPNIGMRMTLKAIVSTVIVTPRRSGVRGSPAARNAPLSMKNIIMPKMPMNIARRNGSASVCTSGSALTSTSSERRREVPDRREDDRQPEGGQKRLIDDAVDLGRFVRPGKARHQHGHAGEERADEDDDDEDDLPADADGRVGGVADEMADHRVIDDALQSGNDVLQHRRPRQLPDGLADGTLDNGSVEFFGRSPGSATDARRVVASGFPGRRSRKRRRRRPD